MSAVQIRLQRCLGFFSVFVLNPMTHQSICKMRLGETEGFVPQALVRHMSWTYAVRNAKATSQTEAQHQQGSLGPSRSPRRRRSLTSPAACDDLSAGGITKSGCVLRSFLREDRCASQRGGGDHKRRVGQGKSYKLALSCYWSSDCFKLNIGIFGGRRGYAAFCRF